ncbi:hypothetical protein JDFR1000234_53 [uncultured archaeal virus]|uniref:Uncharacterized protein n=1 Tax=uncultured archaeal virus TaxID=1960247 RepID=A0A1S5Y335_9VIRU|nr:hypothetical protein JDFR1000234_53 [uncultured archaeal virus]
MRIETKIDIRKLRDALAKKMEDKLDKLAELLVSMILEEGMKKDLFVSGRLLRSWEIVRKELKRVIGFMAPYVKTIEYGGEARTVPHPDLVYWLVHKFGMSFEEANKVGWKLQKWIEKHGTEPHPFIRPALERFKQVLESGNR